MLYIYTNIRNTFFVNYKINKLPSFKDIGIRHSSIQSTISSSNSDIALNENTTRNFVEGLSLLRELAEKKKSIEEIRTQYFLNKHLFENYQGFDLMNRIYKDVEINKFLQNNEAVSTLLKKEDTGMFSILNKIKSTIIEENKNPSEISMVTFQTLGKVIDTTMDKEDFQKALHFFKNNVNIEAIGWGTTFIGSAVFIKKILTTYNNHTFPQSDFDRLNINSEAWKKLKNRQMKANQLIIMTSLALIIGAKIYTDKEVNLTINTNSVDLPNSNSLPSTSESGLGLIIFFKKWIKNLPNWAFNILMSISLMFLGFLIEKYLGVTIKQLSQLDWFILTIVSLIILMNFLILYYYIFTLYLYYKYDKKEIRKPKYIPNFISNFIDEINFINNSEHKKIFIKVDIKNVVIHTVIFIFVIIGAIVVLYLK